MFAAVKRLILDYRANIAASILTESQKLPFKTSIMWKGRSTYGELASSSVAVQNL